MKHRLGAAALAQIGSLRVRHVVGITLAVHLSWLALFFATGGEIRDLTRMGLRYVSQAQSSEVIRVDRSYDYVENNDPAHRNDGYDGQFYYYLALDPAHARDYMDAPGYRYTRILYPMSARVLAGGRADAVPWTLLLVNLLGVALIAFACARLLQAWDVVPGYALLVSLSPGLLVGVQRDLTEPLSYGLAAAALAVFAARPRRAWLWCGLLLGLAALTRQTTLLFVPPLAAAFLLSGSGPPRTRWRATWPAATAFTALAVVPYQAWTQVVSGWIGVTSGHGNFVAIPFQGLFTGGDGFALSRHGVSIVTVAIPTVAVIVLAVGLLRRGRARFAAAAVLLNAALLLVFNSDSNAYTARGRGAVGIALAALLLAPHLRDAAPRTRMLAGAAATLWLVMLPVVYVYGLDRGAA